MYEKDKEFLERDEQIREHIVSVNENMGYVRNAEFDELVSDVFNSLEISFKHLQSQQGDSKDILIRRLLSYELRVIVTNY